MKNYVCHQSDPVVIVAKVLAKNTSFQMLKYLEGAGVASIGSFQRNLGISQSTASKNLNALVKSQLVSKQKGFSLNLYTINKDYWAAIKQTWNMTSL